MADSVVLTSGEPDDPRILWVNEAFTRLTGYGLPEITDSSPSFLYGPETSPATLAELRRLQAEGLPFRGEARLYCKDGACLDLEWTSTPLPDSAGIVTHFLDIHRDVTCRSHRHRTSDAQFELVRGMLEAMPVMVALLDAQGRFAAANRAWCRLADQGVLPVPPATAPEADFLFSAWAELRIPANSPSFAPAGDFQTRLYFQHSGRPWWFHVHVTPLAGNLSSQRIVCLTDVTESVTADLRDLGIARSIVENAPIFILRLAADGRILYANEAILARLGYAPSEVDNLHIWDVDHAQTPTGWAATLAAIMRAGAVVFESTLRTAGGATFPVEIRASVRMLEGEPIFVGFATDISESKRTTASLGRVNKTLDAVANTRQALLRATDSNSLYQVACDAIRENGNYALVWIGIAESLPGKPIRIAARAGDKEGYCDGLRVSWEDDQYGRGPAGTALRERRSIVATPQIDPNFEVWRDRVTQAGFRRTATIPILLPAGDRATLCVYSCHDDSFPPEEVALLEQLAGDIAHASHTLRARETAAQAEARLRSVIASAQADIILLDLDGRILFSNREFADNRYDPDSSFWSTLSPASQRLIVAAVPRVRAGESAQFELERRIPGQPVRYQAVHMQPVVIDGVISQIAVSALDVTDQKLAALEITQSEEKFRKLFESGAIAAYLHDPETGYLVDVNEKGLHDLGYADIAEMRDRAVFDQRPYSKADLMTWLKKAIVEGRQQYEWRIPGRGKADVWHQVYLERVELSGQIRVLAVAVDITARKAAEHSLRLLNANLEASVAERTQQVRLQAMAMDAAVDGVSILFEGRYIYMNHAHASFYGYDRDELLGQTWEPLYTDEERARIKRDIFPIIAETGKWQGETLWLRKDGSETVGEITLNTLSGGYLICTCRDLSPRILAQAALQRSRDELALANDALARAARLKDEFLASMSHELRSPLTGILGMCEVLLDGLNGTLLPGQCEAVTIMESSGKHLLGVINDILDLSKIEAGRLELEYAVTTTDSLLAQAVEMMKPLAERRNQQLVLHNFAAFREIEVDVRRIRQALINLLSNAIKFSPEGQRVTITASWSQELNLITFNVEDRGAGIPPEKQILLFKPFVQIDSSLSRAHQGTGLGLSLVRRIAELHHGGVSLRSELGQGTSLRLSLPLCRPVPVEAHKRLQTSVAGRILLADPAPEIGLVNELTDAGYALRIARNGHEVLALFDEWQPDLALVDLHLGDLEGFDVLRRLRERMGEAKLPTRLVALTSISLASNHAAATAAGAVDVWFKPYVRRSLLQRVGSLLNDNPVRT